jgi:hypothetical protein
VAHFISKLPPALEEGCPCPDVDLVISLIMRMDAETGSNGKRSGMSAGTKRERQALEQAAPVAVVPAHMDLFRMRQRTKVEGNVA